jgi:hypothetical protein
MAGVVILICPTGEAEYFLELGLTGNLVGRSVICPSGKIVGKPAGCRALPSAIGLESDCRRDIGVVRGLSERE